MKGNAYYDPGAGRAAKVRALFTRLAPRYDLVNDVQSFGLHRYWKRRVVRLARVQPGDRALDVCCGTGDLAIALARRGAVTVGLDFNERMLEVARSKSLVQGAMSAPGPGMAASRLGASPTLAFVHGDAQQLPFPDSSFDIVTVGYGLRNLASWETGLAEMRRVARPGARLLVLEFGKPDNPLWRGLYFAYLRLFVPCLGWLFCRDAAAYAYILESLGHYPAQHGVAARMRDLGLANVRIVNLLGGVMSINFGTA